MASSLVPPRSLPVALLISAILPGMGLVYLGRHHRKEGLLTLFSFLMCGPLVFAFGLGLLVAPFIWLGGLWDVVKWWRREQAARRSMG